MNNKQNNCLVIKYNLLKKDNASTIRSLLCLFFLLFFPVICAQDIRITIKKENVKLGEILQEIKNQSGMNMLYSNSRVDNNKNVSVEFNNVPLENALKECLEGKNLNFNIVDNVIIIEPVPQEEKENPQRIKSITQTIRGTVIDADTRIPLTGANIIIINTDPLLGAITDTEGRFRLENVPLGRYLIEISFIGYASYIAREVLVQSGKETVLDIGLSESVTRLEEIRIQAGSNKDKPVNSMATLSARQISMEEANRYAGGFDDPARLVTSGAGAVMSSVRSNGLVIRGNAPKGLLWRMEGIQISNPSHFADFISLGGGGLTALSSQTMANSDFYAGAFPAEYGNAFSGVFDIRMRTGNTEKREHTFQTGVIGIDLASEGPFCKGKRSSYLFNYRYSTLGLLSPILPEEMGVISYQDLSFKLNFPTHRFGVFSVWGIGFYDKQMHKAENDSLEWSDSDDRKEYEAKFTMGAVGISHKIILGEKTYLHSGYSLSGNGFNWSQKMYNYEMALIPKTDFKDYKWKNTFTSNIVHKFNKRHTNKTGIILDRLNYDIITRQADEYGDTMRTYISGNGASNLLHFYSQSKLTIGRQITMNIGLHTQYFTLNNRYTIEPRVGVIWDFMPQQTLSLAYGLHSQLESIGLYLAQQEYDTEKIMPNEDLDFAKAHHIVLGYSVKFSDNLVFSLETYYQKLFDVPVVPGSSVSTINIDDVWSFNDSLVNNGTGKNTGIDLSLERYLNKGFYYLLSASLYESKYTGGDGIVRNTRYNRNYVFNVLAGKEWFTGKTNNNILSVNIRFSYIGGDRITPVRLEGEEIVEEDDKAYSLKLPDAPILCFAFSYRINKPARSGIWSLQLINALAYKEFQEYSYDPETNSIEEVKDLIILPNISYKIKF